MRTLLGLILVSVGFAMAVMWMPEQDGTDQLAVVTDIANKGLARVESSPAGGNNVDLPGQPRTFSPTTPLLPPRASGTVPPPAAAVRPGGVSSSSVQAAVVTVVPSNPVGAANPATTVPGTPGVIVRTNSAATPEEAVKSLQRELRRVGCYQGDIDGDWGTGSRRAMAAFIERVNASLPYDRPDEILLTLVQGYTGSVCGKTCPTGQSMSDSGACIPNAVMAQATRKGAKATIATAAPKSLSPPLHEPSSTMRIASVEPPRRGDATDTGDAGTGRRPATTAGAIGIGPSVAAAAVAAPEPLPGRMAMGGPAPTAHDLIAPPPAAAGSAVRLTPSRGAARSATALPETDSDDVAADRLRREHRGPARVASAPPPPPSRVVVYRSVPRYRPPAAYFAPPRHVAAAPVRSSRAWINHFFDR